MILCVGLACVDMISVVEAFPTEDSDTRCLEHYWQRGGNASNICTVLSLLGAQCSFMGTLAHSRQTRFIEDDFRAHDIHFGMCVYHEDVTTPVATVLNNKSTGSRTIIAPPRSLPELTAKEFRERINLTKGRYKWIHFEGRPSISQIIEMLSYVDQYNAKVGPDERITTSVEIEKVRSNIDSLLGKADYVFIGKDYAQAKGYHSMEQAVNHLRPRCRQGACLICPWSDQGAMALTAEGRTFRASAMPSVKVIDSLGAGDTFNAATILALSQGATLDRALTKGCLVAGTKCTLKGFEGLGTLAHLFTDEGTSKAEVNEEYTSCEVNGQQQASIYANGVINGFANGITHYEINELNGYIGNRDINGSSYVCG